MQTERHATGQDFISFVASSRPVSVSRHDDILRVRCDGGPSASFRLMAGAGTMVFDGALPDDTEAAARLVLAALDAAFADAQCPDALSLVLGRRGDVADLMTERGELVARDGRPTVLSGPLMQRPLGWLTRGDRPAFPQAFVMSGGHRHPLRPPKPRGVVYARFIPWLQSTLTIRVATIEDDLQRFHRWMNDPRVATFWNESGDVAAHRHYLETLIADPHVIPMIGALDGVAFAYFEIYWAKENRLAPFYDAEDYDRGWHVAVGEDGFRGGAFIGAWLPSLMHYLFLDDCRTQRIVGEPAASHGQQIRNLERSGFARIKTIDFPHKRAALVSLLRERFFADGLWRPAPKRSEHRPRHDGAAREPAPRCVT